MYVPKGVFKVVEQSGAEWGIAIAIGASSLPVALLVKLASRCGACGASSVRALRAGRQEEPLLYGRVPPAVGAGGQAAGIGWCWAGDMILGGRVPRTQRTQRTQRERTCLGGAGWRCR